MCLKEFLESAFGKVFRKEMVGKSGNCSSVVCLFFPNGYPELRVSVLYTRLEGVGRTSVHFKYLIYLLWQP